MEAGRGVSSSLRGVWRWVAGEWRIVRGEEKTSLRTRLIAFVALVSLVMAVLWAAKLIRSRHHVEELWIATASPSGEFYKFGTTLKDIVAAHLPRIEIHVTTTTGSRQNMRLLENRDVKLAIVENNTTAGQSVRAISLLFPDVLHLVVRTTTPVTSVGDLRNMPIAVMGRGAGERQFCLDIIKHYRLEENGCTVVELGPQAALQAMRAKNEHAMFRCIGLGNSGMRKLMQDTGATLVSLDQVEALRVVNPYVEATAIPRGTYGGHPPIPDRDIQTAAFHALLLTHDKVPKNIIREITRVLYDHRNELVARNPHAATISFPHSGENVGIPLHPGAEAYYERERPGYFKRHTDVFGLLLSVSILCITTIWRFRISIKERQRDRAGMYNCEILALVKQMRTTENMEDLQEIGQRLFDIFHQVVEDLNDSRISRDSFQLFTFPWEMAIATMRYRETRLMPPPPKGDSPVDLTDSQTAEGGDQ